MKQKILPSVMAKSQQELDEMLERLAGVAKELHLDIADGKFVPNTSLWFTLRISSKFTYNVHLMISNPLPWIEKYGKNVETIIFHPEAGQDVDKVIQKIKQLKKKAGLALKPETTAASIKKYLPNLDYVLILTVHPGFYGAKYLRYPLKKIPAIKKVNPAIKIIVDGGMNPETVKDAVGAGADYVVSGSFITKAEKPKERMREMEKGFGG